MKTTPWIVRALLLLAFAVGSPARSAEFVVVAESPLFTLDTRPFDGPVATGPFRVVAESHYFVLNTTRLGGGGVAESALFTINTRGGIRGGVIGRVVEGGQPVNGASVELLPAGRRVVTGLDGRFLLDGVSSGTGYQLRVTAAGFESATLNNVRVSNGVTDLGDLGLTLLAGTLRLTELSPPVNPAVSVVPMGGAAHRYYRLAAGAGRNPGGTAVTLRRAGGGAVVQSETGTHDWAGAVPGVADADGIVRVIVPAWAVGNGAGASGRFEVLLEGRVVAAFDAVLAEKVYERVWRHRVGAGVSGKIKVFRVGVKGAFEAEVRHEVVGGSVQRETITRTRQGELRGGLEIGAGVKILAGAESKVGAGGFLAAKAEKTFHFDDPDSTDEGENLVKLYLALGDPLSQALGPGRALYNFVGETLEPPLLGSRLDRAGGEIEIGGYAEGELGVGFKAGRQVRIGAISELSGEAAAILGSEEQYRVEDESWTGTRDLALSTLGFVRRGEADIGPGASIGSSRKAKLLRLDLLDISAESAFRASLVEDLQTGKDLKLAVEQEATLAADLPEGLLGWVLYLAPDVANEMSVVLGERLEMDLPEAGMFSRVSAAAPVWNLVSGLGQGGVLRKDQPAALVAGLAESALNDGAPLTYERTVYGAKAIEAEPEIDLDALVAGLGVSFEGSMERGAELVAERGKIWRLRRMGLESSGAFSGGLLPADNIFKLEGRWAARAAPRVASFLSEFVSTVKQAGETVIDAGGAVIRFGEGVIAGGAELVSRWLRPGGGAGIVVVQGPPPPDDGWLPPPAATNYVYGLSGFFEFRSDAVLAGAAALSLPYNEIEVSGLNPAELRVYRLGDGVQRWGLVGGEVDPGARVVTVAITNLGTFALAPPLPAGNLVLTPAGDSLLADGQSTMAFTLRNLMLNTGEAALQPWLYTVSVSGGTLLEPDVRTETPGVQVGSAEAELRFNVRAPVGGNRLRIGVASLAGDASGGYELALVDETAPARPVGVTVSAGQSRLFLAWDPNGDSDLGGYRVYYRVGAAGPPWDGSAAVEGFASPVTTASTNVVLRGLTLGADYYVGVASLDTTGNESPLVVVGPVRTHEGPPLPPSNVLLRFESDGMAHVAWTASEDDGFNDRDVVRYEVWRAVLPGGEYVKAEELPAGSEAYFGAVPALDAGRFVRYAVRSVDALGATSAVAFADRLMGDGRSVDNDGDGMADHWERRYGLNPADPTDAGADADGDGISNLDEFAQGTEPAALARPRFDASHVTDEGRLELTISGLAGRSCTIQVSEDLVQWSDLVILGPAEETIRWAGDTVSAGSRRFYRLILAD